MKLVLHSLMIFLAIVMAAALVALGEPRPGDLALAEHPPREAIALVAQWLGVR